MSDIARWDLTTSRLHQHGQLTIIPDVMPSPDGEYVRYDDIAPLLVERDELRAVLKRIATWATVDVQPEFFPKHGKKGLELIAKEAKKALGGTK